MSLAPGDELLDQHIPSIRGDVVTCSGSHTSSSGPFSHLPLHDLPSHATFLWQTLAHLRTRFAYSSPYMHCPTMNPRFGRHLVVFPLNRIPRGRPIAECHWPADKYIKCNASFPSSCTVGTDPSHRLVRTGRWFRSDELACPHDHRSPVTISIIQIHQPCVSESFYSIDGGLAALSFWMSPFHLERLDP